jgi:hypothetical protein
MKNQDDFTKHQASYILSKLLMSAVMHWKYIGFLKHIANNSQPTAGILICKWIRSG